MLQAKRGAKYRSRDECYTTILYELNIYNDANLDEIVDDEVVLCFPLQIQQVDGQEPILNIFISL